jgi:hypothetical protein
MAWILLFAMLFALLVLKNHFAPKTNVSKKEEAQLPYRRRDYLLTLTEREFFNVLYPIVQKHDALLFCKVRLEDLLWLPKGTEERWSWRGKIKSRHVDFVICNKETIRPLVAIELDDSSHLASKRFERDRFYTRLFEKAGLPFLQVPVKSFYSPQELEIEIKSRITTQLLTT